MKIRNILIFVLLIVLFTGCAERDNVNNPTETPNQSIGNTEDRTTPANPTPESSPTYKPPLEGLKICIDAGHQAKGNKEKEPVAPWSNVTKDKITTGTQKASGIPEYVINLQISKKIKESLEERGAEVLMIRETHDVNISNKERAEMANKFGAHLTLRIHCNGVDNPDVSGIEIYMRDKGDGSQKYKDLANLEFKMANELIEQLVIITGAKNRNVRKSDGYTGINWSEVPCLIIECGYLSNLEEEARLITDEYQDLISQGVLKFILGTELLKY